jgi:hypothetical protein
MRTGWLDSEYAVTNAKVVLAVTPDALILGLQACVDPAGGCANVGGNNNHTVCDADNDLCRGQVHDFH